MKTRKFKMIPLGIIMLAAFSGVIMLLWNLLIPEIFGLATINFWQALGLFALARILFGGFGGFGNFGGARMMMAHHMFDGRNNPLHKKWMTMTPEQRQEFINKRRKFGFGGPFDRNPFNMDEHGQSGKENE